MQICASRLPSRQKQFRNTPALPAFFLQESPVPATLLYACGLKKPDFDARTFNNPHRSRCLAEVQMPMKRTGQLWNVMWLFFTSTSFCCHVASDLKPLLDSLFRSVSGGPCCRSGSSPDGTNSVERCGSQKRKGKTYHSGFAPSLEHA